MNNKELQATRKLLFLDVREATESIGGASVRSWQHWEKGDRTIPDDVAEIVKQLLQRRLDMIATVDQLIAEQKPDKLQFDYYMSYSEYLADHHGATIIDWRLSQSVAAYYVGLGGVELK